MLVIQGCQKDMELKQEQERPTADIKRQTEKSLQIWKNNSAELFVELGRRMIVKRLSITATGYFIVLF